jgi:hypothetical protein
MIGLRFRHIGIPTAPVEDSVRAPDGYRIELIGA